MIILLRLKTIIQIQLRYIIILYKEEWVSLFLSQNFKYFLIYCKKKKKKTVITSIYFSMSYNVLNRNLTILSTFTHRGLNIHVT